MVSFSGLSRAHRLFPFRRCNLMFRQASPALPGPGSPHLPWLRVMSLQWSPLWIRLDYQPLFGKMSPHSSPESLSSGRIKDRTRETAEIEPTSGLPLIGIVVRNKRLWTNLKQIEALSVRRMIFLNSGLHLKRWLYSASETILNFAMSDHELIKSLPP